MSNTNTVHSNRKEQGVHIFFYYIYLFFSFNILHCTNVPYTYELHRHTMMNICSLKLVILLLRYTHSWGGRRTHNSWLTSSLINNFMTETVKNDPHLQTLKHTGRQWGREQHWDKGERENWKPKTSDPTPRYWCKQKGMRNVSSYANRLQNLHMESAGSLICSNQRNCFSKAKRFP